MCQWEGSHNKEFGIAEPHKAWLRDTSESLSTSTLSSEPLTQSDADESSSFPWEADGRPFLSTLPGTPQPQPTKLPVEELAEQPQSTHIRGCGLLRPGRGHSLPVVGAKAPERVPAEEQRRTFLNAGSRSVEMPDSGVITASCTG